MEPDFPPDAVEVGRIAGAWGVKGWLRVEPYSAEPEALFGTKRWFLRPPEPLPPGPPRAWPELLRVVQARGHGDAVVAQVHDMTERDAAQALRGARVYVARASFPTPGEGEFYWVDLIGLAVVNRQGQALGTVQGLMETGAHDVLRLRRPEGSAATDELLIPFVDAYVDRVDLTARVITVDWGADY